MRAMVYERYGSPDRLELREVGVPGFEAGEVLVAVRASSVNSWDWDKLTGSLQGRLDGPRRPRHRILGADVAGVVEAVGSGVTRFRPGDEVMGDISSAGWGGFAEFVAVPEAVLAAKPDRIDYAAAAAVPQAGVLALQALRGRLRNGDVMRLLINGAGGGAGTFAVQLAVEHSAVTAVDHSGKLDTLLTLGAHRVIDYMEDDFTTTGDAYDLIIDLVGQHRPSDYRRALRPGGELVVVGGTDWTLIRLALTRLRGRSRDGKSLGILAHRPDAADIEQLNRMIEAGSVRPVIDRTFSLAEVPEALRFFSTNEHVGKIVITM